MGQLEMRNHPSCDRPISILRFTVVPFSNPSKNRDSKKMVFYSEIRSDAGFQIFIMLALIECLVYENIE